MEVRKKDSIVKERKEEFTEYGKEENTRGEFSLKIYWEGEMSLKIYPQNYDSRGIAWTSKNFTRGKSSIYIPTFRSLKPISLYILETAHYSLLFLIKT